MQSRTIAAVMSAAVAAMALTACGTDSGTATDDTSSAPSHTAVSTAVSMTAGAPDSGSQQGPTSTAAATSSDKTAATLPPGHGVGASAFAGNWQRHESRLTLDISQAGSLLIGASAVDSETWSLTWKPEGRGIVITLGSRTAKYGAGLNGYLSQGQLITGELATDSANTTILRTHGTGAGNTDTLSWCSSTYGSSPECGA